MSYFPPYIDMSGLNIPSLHDIREDLIEGYKLIYGQDCYLEPDSADYQWISIVALRIYDALQSVQLIYNNRGPMTAIGSGLDQIVKMNGIRRIAETYSNCEVYLTGKVDTIINNGIVADNTGNRWRLPNVIQLVPKAGEPEVGELYVTAICEKPGVISALPGDISTIVTPTAGWLGVENKTAAIEGRGRETDAELRFRQSLSVSRPSMTLLTGTQSAIAAMDTVSRYNVLENYTNEYDMHGNPPHSITCVVEGGKDEDIAQTIWENRGLGVYTNGDVFVDIVDPYTGIVTSIGFFRPTYADIYATLTVEGYADEGYTTATTEAIRKAIVDYLNGLQIGADVTISALYAAAMSVTENLKRPRFSVWSITAAKVSSPQDHYDLTILFNEVARCALSNIDIIIV